MKTGKTLRLLSVLLIMSMVLLTPLQAIALGIEQVSETVTPASDPQPSSDGVADIIAELTEKRTADTKHFLLSDGTMMAVQYDTPVHFDTETGWEQYDNSMSIVDDTVSDNEKEYVNKKSNQTVKLAKKAKKNKTVTYAYGDYEIAWGYADGNKSELEFINNTSEKTGNDRFLVLDSVTQQAKYPNIFSSVDLELFVSSTGIKENLILNSASAQNEFVIEYKLKNLTAEQKDGKTVVLENSDGEEVYVLSAPEMYDSAGARSAALSLVITEQKNGKLTLRLAADSEWLQANERVYPVTVDPYYIIGGALFGEDGTSSSTVRTATALHSAYNYENISISDPYVGSSYAYGLTEAVVYFSYLPYMTEGDTVSKAQLSMYNISPSSTYLDIYASAVNITLPSGVKSGTSNVILTDYTNYSHSSTKLDYAEGGGENYVTTWDITTLVRQWMSGAVENNGVALWAPSGTTTGTYAIFNGAKSSTSLRPTLLMYYYNAMGLEDYWTYHSESIGHGALHLNDSNGNLVYSLPLFSATGARNPASLGLVYNSAVYNEIYSGTAVSAYVGYGWQSTLDMHVYDMRDILGWDTTSVGGWGYTMFAPSTESLPDIMALGDSDGTLHYFYYDDTDGVYKDENGSGSTLTTSATVDREYVLTDRSGYKYYFDTSGSLTAYEDINGNTVTITITTTYTNITDAAGRVYRINRVSNVDNRYSSIVLPDGDTITFSYTNTNYLSSVSYPDGTSTTFTYSDGVLSQITANDGSKVTLQYETSAFSRYSSYKRCTAVNGLSPSGTSTGSLAVSYSPGLTTTFTSTTSLGSVVNTYTFDTYGRTITVYNETEGYCSNYDYTSNTTSNPDKNNKVTNVQPGGEIAKNLLGVESGKTAFDGWEFITADKFDNSSVIVTHGSTPDIGNGVQLLPYGNGWCGYAKRVPISSSVSHYTFSVRGKGPGEYDFGIGQFGIYIAYESGSSLYIDSSAVCEADEYSSDWQNLSCTSYNDMNTALWVIIGINGYEGNFCFESPQLEEGSAANDYNLLSPDFYDWDSSGNYDFDANFGDYVELSGNKDQWVSYSYTVPVSSTGKQYEFTAHLWTSQTQIAEHEFDRWYQITISGRGSSGSSSVIKSESINPYVTGDQMLSVSCAPAGAIDSITVKIEMSMLDTGVMIYDTALRVNESGTSYTYDDDGNLVTDQNAKGNGSTSTYNEKNQPLTVSTVSGDYSRYYYDSTGYNVTEMFVEIDTASGTGKLGTFYTYNDYGSVTETLLASVDEEISSDEYIYANYAAPRIRSSQTYDATGNYVVSTTDAAGNTTVNNITSSNGRLNSVTDALNNTVSYSYNNLDLLTGVSSGSAGVSYGYDSLNRLVTVSSGTAVYFFDYDAEGRNYRTSVGSDIYHPTLSETTFVSGTSLPSTVTYGNGAVVRYSYDKYGRVTYKYFGTGYSDYVYYTYNNNGQTARVTEYKNGSYSYYDYTYDTSGRLVRSATPGLTKQLKYDIFDRITGLSFLLGDARYSYAFTYGKNNAVKTETLEDAYTLSYVYDSLGRVTGKTVDPVAYYDEADLEWQDTSGSYLYSYKPGYNPNGGTGATTTLVSQLVTPFTNTAFNYTYDANGNITAENGKQYYYDSLGQLIKTVEGTTVTEYSYTYGGNILSRTVTEDGVVVKTDSYVYSGDADWYDQLYSYNGEMITYDQIGNPLSYRGATLTWTRGRQLASYVKGTDNIAYTYNSEGIRTEKIINFEYKTEYILDGSTVIGERQTNAITGESISAIDYFYDSNGEAVGLKYLGKVYMYEKNLQGDVLNVISPTGQTVVSYSYDEWGKLLSVTGSMATTLGVINSLRYRGYVYDTETALYYLNSRYYDPEVTRFINGDVVTDGQAGVLGYNVYIYAANNPMNNSDPSGKWIIKNAIKWVAKKVVKPAIKKAKEVLSKVDFTYTNGLNLNFSPSLVTFNLQGGISIDSKGNVALQGGFSGGFTTGSPGASVTAYETKTNAPSIDNLNGSSYQLGGSYGTSIGKIPVTAGADFNIIPDSTDSSKYYYGATKNAGIGGSPGTEFHVEWGTTGTWEATKFNIFDVAENIYIKIMEW